MAEAREKAMNPGAKGDKRQAVTTLENARNRLRKLHFSGTAIRNRVGGVFLLSPCKGNEEQA
ncbi:hypothetical protein CCR90_10805 [Rhodovulum sulfidophilum]|uniref:hypothetical protein n=1 Tax=Rhodovulum sulfidophilum TaxID=35806 RepID=UPI001A91305A|nr:hypothetical protein [Rhodovulum sulfidophilum]MBK5924251.1 hypothetical protein [Rhodovulum sulfidophilum]